MQCYTRPHSQIMICRPKSCHLNMLFPFFLPHPALKAPNSRSSPYSKCCPSKPPSKAPLKYFRHATSQLVPSSACLPNVSRGALCSGEGVSLTTAPVWRPFDPVGLVSCISHAACMVGIYSSPYTALSGRRVFCKCSAWSSFSLGGNEKAKVKGHI